MICIAFVTYFNTVVKNYVVTRNTEHNGMDRRYNATWIETPRKEGFTFEVQSCTDANILLSQLKVGQSQGHKKPLLLRYAWPTT